MKDCKCCREVGYNERVVTLHSCYDQDGLRLQGSLAQMQVNGLGEVRWGLINRRSCR